MALIIAVVCGFWTTASAHPGVPPLHPEPIRPVLPVRPIAPPSRCPPWTPPPRPEPVATPPLPEPRRGELLIPEVQAVLDAQRAQRR